MGSQATLLARAARSHMTRYPRLLLVLAAVVPAALPAGATAATPSYPSITTISPLKLGVGDTLAVRGKSFRSGKGRNTVVFKRDGGRAVFVKAGKATSTRISVTIPAEMVAALGRKSGVPVATRFRVRVLAGRFGRRFTAVSGSPVIGPAAITEEKGEDCDGDSIPNAKENDDDNDLLSDTLEAKLKTDPCKPDTDGDAVTDGFEYYSALDLNSAALPFPGKRNYPNALDPADAAIDHDGDSLGLLDEYRAWRVTGSPFPLSYSDGNQRTGGDRDDNKDADRDGVSNYVELNGPLSGQEWWTGFVKDRRCSDSYVESVYPGPRYEGLDFADPDSDGDSVPDGADDIDHDGLSNEYESRARGSLTEPRVDTWCTDYVSVGPDGAGHDGTNKYARVDPFNPCKPVYSAACHVRPPLGYYVKTDTYVEDWQGAQPVAGEPVS